MNKSIKHNGKVDFWFYVCNKDWIFNQKSAEIFYFNFFLLILKVIKIYRIALMKKKIVKFLMNKKLIKN